MTETRRLRALIEHFARELFTNGMGQCADRLVLTIDAPKPIDLGGWGRLVIEDKLEQFATALLSEPQAAQGHSVCDHYVRCGCGAPARGAFHCVCGGPKDAHAASPVLPAPPEADKAWEPFAPTETDPSTTNSGDMGGPTEETR